MSQRRMLAVIAWTLVQGALLRYLEHRGFGHLALTGVAVLSLWVGIILMALAWPWLGGA